jgi:hypothetical protein
MSFPLVLMAASVATSAIQTRSQNRAIAQQQALANQTAQRRVEELNRQQERADLVAQEEKSDRAREADIRIGQIIAASADGGMTVATAARMAASVAGIGGLNRARIESNRKEEAHARRSEQTSIIEENFAQAKGARAQQRNNTIGFVSNTLSSVASFQAQKRASKPAKVDTRGASRPLDPWWAN